MRTWNEIDIECSPEKVFEYARRVDLWPDLLTHYRRVRVLEGDLTSRAVVEMAAYRQFEKLNWPVWWISKMEVIPGELTICYEHIRGVTKGMEVEWRLKPDQGGTKAIIVHEWKQPPVGRKMAGGFIGHVFVHHIAEQTLTGLKAAAENQLEVAIHA